jgi:hypothetical protein
LSGLLRQLRKFFLQKLTLALFGMIAAKPCYQ